MSLYSFDDIKQKDEQEDVGHPLKMKVDDDLQEKELCAQLESMCLNFSQTEDKELVDTIKKDHFPLYRDIFKRDFKGIDDSEFKENVRKSKEVFGLIMRGSFGRYHDQKFQPCKDELDLLKSLPKAMHLCRDLRYRVSLKDFYQILLPGELSDDEKEIVGNPIDYLKNRNTIFHTAYKIRDDQKEFEDLQKRAEDLAEETKERGITEVQLLDGHGRMLVLILRALDKAKQDLEVMKFELFEVDDIVHEYHEYVFSNRISCLKQCIISQKPLPVNKMIYLNFCSVQSTKAFDWTEHFEDDTGDLACVKENVLKFIARVTSEPENCTVMISFILKHSMDDYVYQAEFNKTMGHYLTGLGFFKALLKVFGAKIISIRPESEIIWEDQKVKTTPKNLRSGGHGCPFITLLVKPGNYETDLDELFDNGHPRKYCKDGETKKIANLKEELKRRKKVEVTSGINQGKQGLIVARTAARARVILDDDERRISINQIELIE